MQAQSPRRTSGLIDGPISTEFLLRFQAGNSSGGAVASFFGVIRADKSAIQIKESKLDNRDGKVGQVGQDRQVGQDGKVGQDKVVNAIEYSAYAPMAEKILQSLHAEILEKYKLIDLLILHSTGRVKAGEPSMLVAVISKHRAAAFDALRETVERIKAEAPVWKKEIFSDGKHRWVGSKWKNNG